MTDQTERRRQAELHRAHDSAFDQANDDLAELDGMAAGVSALHRAMLDSYHIDHLDARARELNDQIALARSSLVDWLAHAAYCTDPRCRHLEQRPVRPRPLSPAPAPSSGT